MSFGPIKVFTATMASGNDSASVNLTKAWSKIFVHVPSMSTAAMRTVYGSDDNSTFIAIADPNTPASVDAFILSGASSIQADLGRVYDKTFLYCGTMSTACDRDLYISDNGTTYYQAKYPLASGVTNPGSIIVGSGIVGAAIELPIQSRYYQLRGTAVVSGGVSNTFWGLPKVEAPTYSRIPSSITNYIVEVPCHFQYVKFVTSAVVSGGGTYKLFCSD